MSPHSFSRPVKLGTSRNMPRDVSSGMKIYNCYDCSSCYNNIVFLIVLQTDSFIRKLFLKMAAEAFRYSLV